MAQMNCDGRTVIDELLQQQREQPDCILFVKHMAHHLVDLDLAFMAEVKNIFLIRDPQQMLPSLTVQLPEATLSDTGLRRQWLIYQQLEDSGQLPVVVDSRELLLNPRRVLGHLCAHLELAFDDQMLSWPPGPRVEDGVWAQYWYEAVHKSAGFSPYREKSGFPRQLEPLLVRCQPWYEKLYGKAIRADARGESE